MRYLMKILLMGVQKLVYMPYMHSYLSNLDLEKHDVHLLYWNRDGKEEKLPDYNITYHEFNVYQENEVPKIAKINSFIKYRKKAKRLIAEEKFDLIIVLNTVSGFLVQDILWKKSKKYIYDYRDPSLENIGVFKYLIGIMVKNSLITFVSSDGFRKLLPNSKNIVTTHNLQLDSLHHRNVRKAHNRSASPLRIRFWGMIRNESINKGLINRIANDKRFELHYHGSSKITGKNLEEYCQSNGIHNVFFHGAYEPVERYEFAKNTDILHTIYENDMVMVHAMANRFYDGIVQYIPQICTKGSFMGQKVTSNGVGIELDPNDPSFADKLYEYYLNIKWEEFHKNCDTTLNKVLEEYHASIDIIHQSVDQTEVTRIKKMS